MDLRNLKESCGHIDGYDKKLSIFSVRIQHLWVCECLCVGWGWVCECVCVGWLVCEMCVCVCRCDYVALHIHVEVELSCLLSYCIISHLL